MRSKGYCGRCKLTFATRWMWANHGCQLTGPDGEYSQLLGSAVRFHFPAETYGDLDADLAERARDTLAVRRTATQLQVERAQARAIRPFSDAMMAFTAGMLGVAKALHEANFFAVFGGIEVAPAPLQRASYEWERERLTSSLTGDSFSELVRRFNSATSQPYPEATIEHQTVTVRVNQCPVPAPDFPQRWAALGEHHIRRLNRHDRARARNQKKGRR